MFWKPAITGCGANFINEPSRSIPNSACNRPPSRTMAKNTSSVAETLGAALAVGVAMQQRKQQQAEKERRGDARRVDARRAVAEQHA